MKRAQGGWWDTHKVKVYRVVVDFVGEAEAEAEVIVRCQTVCKAEIEEVMGWVRKALPGTMNNSPASPEDVGFSLLKTVKDTKLGSEVLTELV